LIQLVGEFDGDLHGAKLPVARVDDFARKRCDFLVKKIFGPAESLSRNSTKNDKWKQTKF